MKSGDILGGLASATNTVTGIVSGLASNQGTKLPTSAANADNTVGKDNLKAAQANNNFYANIGVNLGFNKSSSKSNSHSESAVVTTIKGKDENSSITYNNVKNVEYVGTQAQDTKFIYNNVENINKTAVELNNSHSSTGKSSGISTGVTIGYGDGTQTEFNGVSISASKSNMNSNGTTYQNGRFVNVDEVHNNTKNMTLSGFNQEGGTVTGNIENLTIESKQNTSTTKGSTKGGSLSVSANGLPSGSANYSKTNGERRVVDNASTFIIGDGSDLKVAKLENTAAAIGTTENGKLSIDEYVGYNLENVDKLKTAGGSVGVSTSGITSIGVNYSDKKQEGITKNTVIGNVEIGKSSGDEINRDLDTMTEITEDRDFKTNVNVESQTINYIKNPEKFKEDLQKAKNEVEDLENAVKNTSNPLGKDKRNVFSNLRAQRWSTSFYNVIGSRVEELARQFKAREINEEDLKEALRDVVKGYGKDIGIDFDVVYLDESTMPKDSKGSTGSSYIVDRKNRKVLIPIDVNKIEDIKKVLGTLTEEVAHGKDALEGRQDKKVAEDKSNDEEGLESLGRPANEYVKKRFGEDNNSKIKLTTDGIDLSNADVGEKVGDVVNENYEIATFSSAGIGSAGAGLIGIGGLSLLSENNEYIKKVTIEEKEKLSKFGNNVKILYAVAKTLIEEKLKEKGIEADVKITEDKNGNIMYTMTPLPEEKRVFKLPPMVPPKQETPKERWEREERFRREQKEKIFKLPPMVPPKQETPKERWEREERFRREEQEFFNELQKPNGIPILKEEPVNIIKSQVKPGDVVETPDNAKDKNKFKKGKNEGDSGYENLEDGSWWERDVAGDRAHSGSGSWKRWPKKPDRRHKKKDPDRRTINNEGKVLRR